MFHLRAHPLPCKFHNLVFLYGRINSIACEYHVLLIHSLSSLCLSGPRALAASLPPQLRLFLPLNLLLEFALASVDAPRNTEVITILSPGNGVYNCI